MTAERQKICCDCGASYYLDCPECGRTPTLKELQRVISLLAGLNPRIGGRRTKHHKVKKASHKPVWSSIEYTLHFDGSGGTRGSRWGWVLRSGLYGRLVKSGSGRDVEPSTSTIGEALALLNGLEAVAEHRGDGGHKIKRLLIRGDCQSIITSLNSGKSPEVVREIMSQVRQLLTDLDWTAEWVPRKYNQEADDLAAREFLRTGKVVDVSKGGIE